MTDVPSAQSSEEDASGGDLPRVFGRYVLFDQIGRGGMADIYLARADTELGGSRLVVVKQILAELTRDEAFERMFISEAKLAAQLHNANVVQVFDLGREGERLFIGMEYVEGFDLHQLLRELSRAKVALPAEFALFVVREVLSALAYAHRARVGEGRRGVVHRDVSPSNVLISFEGEVKLCDFGIARALTERGLGGSAAGAADFSAPNMAGKTAYMAPEQARAENVGLRADLFAAGIVLWELFAGRRLYKGGPEQTLALARAADVPKLPRQGLPAQATLQALLDRALAVDPADRFESAAEMQRAVDAYAAEAGLLASQLRFGSFLKEHFAARILETRRENERAAQSHSSMLPPSGAPVEVQVPRPAATSSVRVPDIVADPSGPVPLPDPGAAGGDPATDRDDDLARSTARPTRGRPAELPTNEGSSKLLWAVAGVLLIGAIAWLLR